MINFKTPKEDNILECFLYPRFCYSLNPDDVTENMLYEEIDKFKQDFEPFIKDYLWHRDNFNFYIRTKHTLQFNNIIDGCRNEIDFKLLPHIYISLQFDEDIGDEWFVVFLILNLTKKYEGLIVNMIDSDGEFLLIEAANVIPVWVTPELSQNRLFLINGALHLVQGKENICSNDLNSLYQRAHVFKMSDEVQKIIQKKISIYPDEIERRKHKARAYLPEKAAYILSKDFRFISAAVRTICHSDSFERKVCRGMRYFPPEQRIMANVKMTKYLYAMASHCRYTGDLQTGWKLPPTDSSDYNAHILGIKIACGLEMIVSLAQKEFIKFENWLNSEEGTEKNMWGTFLKRLEMYGYFRGLVDGSQKKDILLEKARYYYIQNLSSTTMNQKFKNSETQKILAAYKEIQSNDLETEAKELSTLSPEDSDSWLNVDYLQLETMLNKQFEMTEKLPELSFTLQDKVKTFIDQRSGIEGIQFFGNEEIDLIPNQEDNQIDFDPELFDTALTDILDFVVPGEDDELIESSDSEFGGDNQDLGSQMNKYMKLLDHQLEEQMHDISERSNISKHSTIEENLLASIKEEVGGTGPLGNILGPIEKLKHLQINSTDVEN